MLKKWKAQVGSASDIKNGIYVLQETFQYGRFKTYGDFTYSYLLDQWLLQLAGKKTQGKTQPKPWSCIWFWLKTVQKCSLSMGLGVETIIPSSHDLLHNFHGKGYPSGNSVLLSPPDRPQFAKKGCEAVRGAQLRLCAGTANPVAELLRGLRWFYLEATVSIKLVIAPHGLWSRPVLKWSQSLLYLNMYSTHSLSGSGATSKPGRWLIKGSLY